MNPETALTIVPLPYSSRIDRHGVFRESSLTAAITDSTVTLAKENPNFQIYIPGESTFGPNNPSTSELMKQHLIRKGIAAERITIDSGLNDTESQLRSINNHGIGKALVVNMAFHNERVTDLMRQNRVNGITKIAEEIILRTHKGATPAKLEKFAASKIKMLGMSKVYLFERAARVATKLGRPGKFALNSVRGVLGKGGPTVTDYHYVDSASNFLKQRKKAVISS